MYLLVYFDGDGNMVGAMQKKKMPNIDPDHYIDVKDGDLPREGTGDYYLEETRIVEQTGVFNSSVSNTYKKSYCKRRLKELDKKMLRSVEDSLLATKKIDDNIEIDPHLQACIDEKNTLRAKFREYERMSK